MFSEAEFTRRADALMALAHEVCEATDPRYDGYYAKDAEPGCVYHFFEMSITPLQSGGVGYLAKIYHLQDCSCCPIPVFALGRGESAQEALDALESDILGNIPRHSVGDEWKPTLGDLLQA